MPWRISPVFALVISAHAPSSTPARALEYTGEDLPELAGDIGLWG